MIEPKTAPYSVKFDLTNCEAEPVHFIRHYQLPAFMLLVDPRTLKIKAHTDNFPLGSSETEPLIGRSLNDIFKAEDAERIVHNMGKENYQAYNPITMTLRFGQGMETGPLNVILNPSGDDVLLEFEPGSEKLTGSTFLFRIDQALNHIQVSGHSTNLLDKVVEEVRNLTEYDRVMLYRFDHEYNGEVVAEAKNEEMEPFLHLRYPHTDIPEMARKLFMKNSVRHIVNTDPNAVSIVRSSPVMGEVDLTFCANRGSSPIHLRYLNNMGVKATLTIALVVNQKLWGLIACHHNTPKLLDYRLRSIISLMGKVVSGHLALRETADFRSRILAASVTRSVIFDRMSENYDIVEGLLTKESPGLLDLASATGAAVVLDNETHLMGETPVENEIQTIVEYLTDKPSSIFTSEEFFKEVPAAQSFNHPPAGIMSIRLSTSPAEYIMWFRPEIRKTVKWGGHPDKRMEIVDGKIDLHPELSFMKWEQRLEGISSTWEPHEMDAANGLRNDIKEVILRKYQEARRLNGQLVDAYQELETFSYSVSHDLRAPLRNIKSFAEILQEDYNDKLDDFGREALRTIVTSVGRMNSFIDDILEFSRSSKVEVTPLQLSFDEVIDEVWNDLKHQTGNARFVREGGGASIIGDFMQLKQLVLNILSNAFKYSSKVSQPEVSLRTRVENDSLILEVTDNGVGFDMKHADRIFTVFNRLVSKDDFEGTGVGLATASRIVEKHNGGISVESEPGVGTTFTVKLPTGIT